MIEQSKDPGRRRQASCLPCWSVGHEMSISQSLWDLVYPCRAQQPCSLQSVPAPPQRARGILLSFPENRSMEGIFFGESTWRVYVASPILFSAF